MAQIDPKPPWSSADTTPGGPADQSPAARAVQSRATVLLTQLGYESTTALVKRSLKEKRPFCALAIEGGLLMEIDVLAEVSFRR